MQIFLNIETRGGKGFGRPAIEDEWGKKLGKGGAIETTSYKSAKERGCTRKRPGEK